MGVGEIWIRLQCVLILNGGLAILSVVKIKIAAFQEFLFPDIWISEATSTCENRKDRQR